MVAVLSVVFAGLGKKWKVPKSFGFTGTASRVLTFLCRVPLFRDEPLTEFFYRVFRAISTLFRWPYCYLLGFHGG